jgi:hypothetical protein
VRWGEQRGGAYASTVARGFVSQAVSNPIYVDVDGNGRFDAPGLAVEGAAGGRLLGSALLIAGLAGVGLLYAARGVRTT